MLPSQECEQEADPENRDDFPLPVVEVDQGILET